MLTLLRATVALALLACSGAIASRAQVPDTSWHRSNHYPGVAFRDSIGDPSRTGHFAYFARAAAGASIGAHRHTADMTVHVVSGRKLIVMGNPLDNAHVRTYPRGATFVIPKGTWHVEWWDEDTVEEISGDGPLLTERPESVIGFSGATPQMPSDTTAEAARVIALERAYWDAEKRGDHAMMDSLLAPDYRYLSARGGTDRSKHDELALLDGKNVALLDYTFSHVRSAWTAPDAIVLHYIIDQRVSFGGRLVCPHSGSMTAWTRRAGKWLRVARTEYVIGSATPPACPGGS